MIAFPHFLGIGRSLVGRFQSFVYRFSPGGAKNDIQKRKSTMLPQARAL